MPDKLTVACIQTQASTDVADNIAASLASIRKAAAQGAEMVSLPEMVNLMQVDKVKALPQIRTQAEDQGLVAYRAIAAELGLWIHVGSMIMLNDRDSRNGRDSRKPFVNRGFLLSDKGEIVAVYDKLHMFDVDLSANESYCESDAFVSGDVGVCAQSPWGVLGLSICYDLRFAYLYRALAQAGARLLFVPAAFTRTTGAKHWHILLQARAIETGCWVIAANQGADHADGRQTYGHSLIIDPDGKICMDAGMVTGAHVAQIDLGESQAARMRIPSLYNDNPPQRIDTVG